MNPLVVILAAGYGYLAGNPVARRRFTDSLATLGGKGVDTLNKMGGEANVPAANTDADEQ